METLELKRGSVVRKKNQQEMIISKIDSDRAVCEWIDEEKIPHTETVTLQNLEIIR